MTSLDRNDWEVINLLFVLPISVSLKYTRDWENITTLEQKILDVRDTYNFRYNFLFFTWRNTVQQVQVQRARLRRLCFSTLLRAMLIIVSAEKARLELLLRYQLFVGRNPSDIRWNVDISVQSSDESEVSLKYVAEFFQ